MSELRLFINSTIGKKYLMGITGLIWAGFVMGHMAGNILLFVGADAYNTYSHMLTSGKIIYVIEAVLLISLAIHIWSAVTLTRMNRAARGAVRYEVSSQSEKAASLSSRTMIFQGTLILVFFILHLATFKYGEIYKTTVGGVEMRDIHRLVIEIFQSPGYVAWYIVSLIILGMHLKHGVGSLFQSLGLRNDVYAPVIQKVSLVYAFIVSIGFISQPIYVFLVAKP